MTHYPGLLIELASRPNVVFQPEKPVPEVVIHDNILFNPKMQKKIKLKEDMVPWYDINPDD